MTQIKIVTHLQQNSLILWHEKLTGYKTSCADIPVYFLTVPSTPLTPRVFVTQSKATSGSQTCTGALFRWTSPLSSNGVIDQYIVTFYHTGSNHLTKKVLSSTARHFSLDECLQQNYTYSFQVRELV